ncbi:hydroxyacid dehydrogenase [Piscinibacter sp.]|mgnify:CR=1 FL=1|uniref:hydroxyacid dehydrogenase n=1 Tax=Piscinibacter sp. TaxID=1903157 RepID=UPI001B642DB9|nr:hydroxyacid dehydrogenase [Piscinibacter sp.]MBK7532708.1 hydroxyacid dehydrogenase [Piscinibacter sp.]MBP6545023.1 hydroxyacid dehydrogenase [Piscinibacter sp.]HPG78584.1 hydroxyacid dehydrogenase [Piscinibacter sp.]
MARIVITEFMDAPAVAQLAAKHEVLYDATLVDDAPRLLAEAARADAIVVRNRTQVRGALLEALRRCKVVGRLGVGLDNIDVAACEQRGMAVIPATGANALSVAEYVVGTAMLLLRGAYQSSAAVAAGQWPRTALSSGREIAGKTLGLIGFGSIGQLTASLARALGMTVIAFDAMMDEDHPAFAAVGARCTGLDEVIRSADVLSLHVPLVESTRGLFDAARIASMKPGAVLINTARGGILDEVAVAAALKSGQLGGAAIDVFGTEPLSAAPHFQGCPNLLLTPHVAGLTAEANERVSSLIAGKVLEALA